MIRLWVGARPKTLPAAVVPVAVGVGCAVGIDGAVWWRALPALIVSLALQIGVNYANDYSDGIRGTDEQRVGPTRLVASGLASPGTVKIAAFTAFGVAAVAGLVLALATTLWLVPVGVACIAAGWFYTGGPNPYGYTGLGEVFVFIFFGLLATAGTTFVIVKDVTWLALISGCVTGSLACALLVVNNLRDIPSDTLAGKRTLAVRLGDKGTRSLYKLLIMLAIAGIGISSSQRPWALIGLGGMLLARWPIKQIKSGVSGFGLVKTLGATARVQLVAGLLFALGLAFG